jgi:hypothetical protein
LQIRPVQLLLKFRSFEAVEHRIAESPNEWDFDVLN